MTPRGRGRRSEGGSKSAVTPGGPRARRDVHEVMGGEVVVRDATGKHVTVPAEMLTKALDALNGASEERVLTPGGLRPRSFVHRIDEGHGLQIEGQRARKVHLATKRVMDLAPLEAAHQEVPALGSGWIAYAYWNNGTGHPIDSFATSWTVPKEPSTKGSQTIFLFNGIENFGANYGILQPVLQWGVSAAGGGAYWSVASWYVTSGGSAFHTSLVPVSVGQRLKGVMRRTGQSGASFDYTSEFEGISGTSLPVQGIAELTWCNETLEAYGISNCSDYPASLFTGMESIGIRHAGGVLTPTWTPINQVTDCGQHCSLDRRLIPVHLPPPFNITLYLSIVNVRLFYRTIRVSPPWWLQASMPGVGDPAMAGRGEP